MQRESDLEAKLRKQIREERRRQRDTSTSELCILITQGEIVTATGNLLFHTPPEKFAEKLKSVLEEVTSLWEKSRRSGSRSHRIGKAHILGFLVKLSIDLGSFLPNWNLKKGLDEAALNDAASTVRNVLKKLETACPDVQSEIVHILKADTMARLKAEGVSGDEVENEADKLLGGSLTDYTLNIAAELKSSNLFEAAESRLRGATKTELGNDYAAFLQYMIWLGGSFVTTNPVLIKVAWDTDPQRWSSRIDQLIRSKYTPEEISRLLHGPAEKLQEAVTELNSLVTMSVVGENCRLLRDIFLLTDGQEGYVSLQVNPKNHDNGDQMVAEAKRLYEELRQRLGGVPNVVFKLPATCAGLYAAEKLTSAGIGVTITVSFAVFQALQFGKLLDCGQALVTYIALMNGRMAFPVRDELRQRGIEGGVEAARWAGVEVARKSYHHLYDTVEEGGMAVDPARVKLLIASLRVYDDWLPDISELWGSPVITFFPNVRRKYDSHRRELREETVLNKTPSEDLDTLLESEIFRQAWWVPADAQSRRPQRVLSVEEQDHEALVRWKPVANTLGQFIDLYEQMGEMVKGRMKQLESDPKGE
jgi:transaldolase